MRALLVVRPDAATRFGGDTVLARDTFTALKDLGVDADLVESDRPDPRGYDIAHVFNVGQPEVCKRQLDACHAAGVPVALSPIWLDLREFFGRAQAYEHVLLNARTSAEALAKLRRLAPRSDDEFLDKRARANLEHRHAQQAELLRAATVLLPNGAIEARDCLVKLGVRERPLVIVRIAANLEPARAWSDTRAGVLAVGRIETRKNQTGLLFGLRDDDVPIDIVGAAYHPDLVALCKKWCPRAQFHGRLPRQQLLELMGRAEVHALVSWCETAGIASMEAGAAGAKLVVADRGAEVEYFGDDAEYADPADPESIRAAVQRALARPARHPGDSLDRRLRSFAWRHAAEETVRAYRIALGAASLTPPSRVAQTS